MDWMIDSTAADSVRELRSEVMSYLTRHSDGAELTDAKVVLSELITNGARHAAGPLWVSIDWGALQPVLRVVDLGPGFDLAPELPVQDSVGGRGLFIASALAERLEAHRRDSGGSVVTAVLAVKRGETRSFDPPRRRYRALPALVEAEPTGGFGKEAFLRALVVQLAQVVGEHHGPDGAESAVAQVGIDVGGQMEAEYAAAHALTGRLTTAQLADCYVRLKHAIDGNFSVVEISEHRIVLENTRCPFGDAVKAAPALCRMTSSVFGGIAARNADHGATVSLEERIAIGDVRCRVVVDLDPDPSTPVPWVHRYTSPI